MTQPPSMPGWPGGQQPMPGQPANYPAGPGPAQPVGYPPAPMSGQPGSYPPAAMPSQSGPMPGQPYQQGMSQTNGPVPPQYGQPQQPPVPGPSQQPYGPPQPPQYGQQQPPAYGPTAGLYGQPGPYGQQSPYQQAPGNQPKKRPWLPWVIIGIALVLIVGTVVGIVVANSSSTSTANLSAKITKFFSTPVTDSSEKYFQQQAESAGQDLAGWLEDKNVDISTIDDLVTGKWNGDNGYLTFSGTDFYWYQSRSELDDNYYHGTILTVPGCQLSAGYALERSGAPCYSVFVRYSDEMVYGDKTSNVYYGLFNITVKKGVSMTVYNHRTDNEWIAKPV